jgi:hypothetical protein
MELRRPQQILAIGFAFCQIQASCEYSPPPVLSQGQGADTLGPGRFSTGAEVGWGTSVSWWEEQGLANPEVSSGLVGASRLRLGVTENLDVGLVGGLGPERAFVVGPEAKWRFARFTGTKAEGSPGFHAALIAGMGIGSAELRYGAPVGGAPPRHPFLAPYQGLTASGGIPLIQMYTGLRLAESETLGNAVRDLTLYPVLAFGIQLRPLPALTLFAEADLVGGITTRDKRDSAVMFYPSAGASLSFDLWTPARGLPEP